MLILKSGTGASSSASSSEGSSASGGKNTTYYGKKFEELTDNEKKLLLLGYNKININKNTKKMSKYNYYLTKKDENKKILFFLHNSFKFYIKNKYNINLFRHPDEAYIIKYKTGDKIIKILEKKEQRCEGSIETKLWSGPSLKREYELVFDNKFKIYYGFCIKYK